MLRLTPLALSASLVPIFGCTDVPVAMSEGSSSGSSDDTVVSPGTSTSLGGSASGPVDSTTSSSEGGVASTTTESSTTSDPVSTGHARMLVVEGLPYDVSPSVFEYAEGVASDLIPLTGELPRDVTFSDFSVSDAGTDLGYCMTMESVAPYYSSCFAIDLRTHPPGPAQPLAMGPVPELVREPTLEWVEATESFVLGTHDPDMMAPDAIYVAAMLEGVLQLPELVAQAGPGQSFHEMSVRGDGAWLGFTAATDDGPVDAFLAPLDAPDPLAAVRLSDLVDPERRAQAPIFVPGHEDLVLYLAGFGWYEDSLWYVDLSGPAPAAPVRVDDPLPDDHDLYGPVVAPDGHALVYWVGSNTGGGELMFVDLSTGVPQAPIRLSTLGDGQVGQQSFMTWSPDSRLVAYQAAHRQPGTRDAYVVEASGSDPGEPRLVSALETGALSMLRFDDASQWLYFIGRQDGDEPQLHRVEVSGAEPGPSQHLSDGDMFVFERVIPSPDWSVVLYRAAPEQDDSAELYAVDLSGPAPAAPVRISITPFLGYYVYEGWFSRDGSVVLYVERGYHELDRAMRLRAVDMSSLEIFNVSGYAEYVAPIVE